MWQLDIMSLVHSVEGLIEIQTETARVDHDSEISRTCTLAIPFNSMKHILENATINTCIHLFLLDPISSGVET